MTQPLFIFKSVNGKQTMAHQSEVLFRQHMQDHDGATYEIRLRETKRSLTQNRYYWAWLEYVEAETGNSASDLNEYFKRACLPPKFVQVLGKEVKLPRSTTELNKVEFGEFLDKCSALCGITLLDPAEAGYTSNY